MFSPHCNLQQTLSINLTPLRGAIINTWAFTANLMEIRNHHKHISLLKFVH